jgi:hypothetical protein
MLKQTIITNSKNTDAKNYLSHQADSLSLRRQALEVGPVLAGKAGVLDPADDDHVLLVALLDDRGRTSGLELFGIKTGKFFIVGTLKDEPKK